MNKVSVLRTAASDPATWIGRIVYESAANTVALSSTPATQVPLGIVENIDEDLDQVVVCTMGRTHVRVGENGLTAGTDTFISANDDSGGAANDGKADAASAGDFYVGKVLLQVDASEDDLVPCDVFPGQLDAG